MTIVRILAPVLVLASLWLLMVFGLGVAGAFAIGVRNVVDALTRRYRHLRSMVGR